MIEIYSKFDITTNEVDDTFIVSFNDKKTCKQLFECEFIVYSNFDKKGLIEDAIDIYKRKLNK